MDRTWTLTDGEWTIIDKVVAESDPHTPTDESDPDEDAEPNDAPADQGEEA